MLDGGEEFSAAEGGGGSLGDVAGEVSGGAFYEVFFVASGELSVCGGGEAVVLVGSGDAARGFACSASGGVIGVGGFGAVAVSAPGDVAAVASDLGVVFGGVVVDPFEAEAGVVEFYAGLAAEPVGLSVLEGVAGFCLEVAIGVVVGGESADALGDGVAVSLSAVMGGGEGAAVEGVGPCFEFAVGVLDGEGAGLEVVGDVAGGAVADGGGGLGAAGVGLIADELDFVLVYGAFICPFVGEGFAVYYFDVAFCAGVGGAVDLGAGADGAVGGVAGFVGGGVEPGGFCFLGFYAGAHVGGVVFVFPVSVVAAEGAEFTVGGVVEGVGVVGVSGLGGDAGEGGAAGVYGVAFIEGEESSGFLVLGAAAFYAGGEVPLSVGAEFLRGGDVLFFEGFSVGDGGDVSGDFFVIDCAEVFAFVEGFCEDEGVDVVGGLTGHAGVLRAGVGGAVVGVLAFDGVSGFVFGEFDCFEGGGSCLDGVDSVAFLADVFEFVVVYQECSGLGVEDVEESLACFYLADVGVGVAYDF